MPIHPPEIDNRGASTSTEHPERTRFPVRRGILMAIICVAALLLVGVVLLTAKWPFSRAALTRSLQRDSHAHVQIGSFRETYFPHPGCVAENVTFERDGAAPRLTVRRVTFVGSYVGMLHHYVPRIVADGAVLDIPAGEFKATFESGSGGQSGTSKGPGTSVGEIDANGSLVRLARHEGEPLVFQFQSLKLSSVASRSPIRFSADVKMPVPRSELQIEGRIGPVNQTDATGTPLTGSYSLMNAELGQFSGVGGTLASKGKFDGTLQALKMQGDIAVPDFSVDSGVQTVSLKANYQAVLNATNGDVQLTRVQSSWGKTTIISQGTIQSEGGKPGKVVRVDMVCPSGTVQDLLRLFADVKRPAMMGNIKFQANATLPSGDAGFLDRLKLAGQFGIAGGRYSSPHTQKELDILSARARGEADKIEDDQDKDKKNGTDTVDQDLENVVSNVKGDVTLRKGIADFSKLSFDVPGASAVMDGTYSLKNTDINMHGTVHLQSELSKTTTGMKSFVLKIVQPFTKHNRGDKGATVSVRVTGKYGHPSFAVSPIPGGQ